MSFVALNSRFTPGWPWPEDSWGLTPMFGEDGWCRGCGTPFGAQSGELVMQGTKFPTANVWTPNWRYDVVCVSAKGADEIRERFTVEMRPVHKPRARDTGAMQLIPSITAKPWYDASELRAVIPVWREKTWGHLYQDRPMDPSVGGECSTCGRWRWYPVGIDAATIDPEALEDAGDFIASPEIFGSGMSSSRALLFSRPLAELLHSASPRNWTSVEVHVRSHQSPSGKGLRRASE